MELETLRLANDIQCQIEKAEKEIKEIDRRIEMIGKHEAIFIPVHEYSKDNPFFISSLNYEKVIRQQELRRLKSKLNKM